jgi:hypothetical protein
MAASSLPPRDSASAFPSIAIWPYRLFSPERLITSSNAATASSWRPSVASAPAM